MVCVCVGGKRVLHVYPSLRFLRFLCLEFMPGFKHFREDSLEAPRGCQNASWQMGCNSMTRCKQVGGHGCAACHGPDTSLRSECSPAAAVLLGPPCPARGTIPEKLSLHAVVDLTKHCCKPSLTVWSVIRMKPRFFEALFLKGQEYLSDFRGPPFAWQQDCVDPQSPRS